MTASFVCHLPLHQNMQLEKKKPSGLTSAIIDLIVSIQFPLSTTKRPQIELSAITRAKMKSNFNVLKNAFLNTY
jgi:hypothetical protein